MSIINRGILASKRYVEAKGYEVLQVNDEDSYINLVCTDDGVLAFIHVQVTPESFEQFSEDVINQSRFEEGALKFLIDDDTPDMTDMTMRFDVINMKVFSGNNAMLRHHINCIKGM